jgi:hypothetical protein
MFTETKKTFLICRITSVNNVTKKTKRTEVNTFYSNNPTFPPYINQLSDLKIKAIAFCDILDDWVQFSARIKSFPFATTYKSALGPTQLWWFLCRGQSGLAYVTTDQYLQPNKKTRAYNWL